MTSSSESIVPMEPVLVREPFDEPGWIHQVKWDGVRCIAHVTRDGVTLHNRKGKERTAHYPELQQLSRQCSRLPCILDGEIVALNSEGRVSFPAVLRRDLATTARRMEEVRRMQPIYYMIFDLLKWDGQWINDWSLRERMDELVRSVHPEGPVHLVEENHSGRALFASTKDLGIEGIVSKQLTSPYVFGVRRDWWKKIKHFKRIHAVVGGLSIRHGVVSSLWLGLYEGAKLRCIGKAGSGMNQRQLEELSRIAERVPKHTDSPFQGGVPTPKRDIRFTPPVLVVEVEFLEWTSEGSLRAPVILGFRDVDPTKCHWT